MVGDGVLIVLGEHHGLLDISQILSHNKEKKIIMGAAIFSIMN